MKKIGIFVIILVIAVFVVFYINNLFEGSNTPPSTTQDAEEEQQSSEEQSETTEDEEDETITEKISQSVTEVVDKTINFFVKDKLNVVAVGDSLTQGVGDSTDNGGYLGVLENALENSTLDDYTISNYGKRGNRTDQLLKRLEEEPELSQSIRKADLILITIGANDIMKIVKENFLSLSYDDFTVEQPKYQKRLHDIFKKIRSENSEAHIFLIGLYNPFSQYFEDIPELDKIINDYNFISRKVLGSYEPATYIPVEDLFINANSNLFAEDNFHPNKEGYNQIGERVIRYLEQAFEIEEN
ncbi:SGNH/GDSL hydrolase family protein [Salinibacillus xinjiangensis]|nr:SGNH/GDSL hydrolase family protein [Salinibacillus xinjiangensis]